MSAKPEVAMPEPSLSEATPSAQELIELVGMEDTKLLCERLGGLSIEIGAPSPTMIKVLGETKAIEIKGKLGAGRVYITRNVFTSKPKQRQILQMRSEGYTVEMIAAQLGVSDRWVYMVCSRHSEQRALDSNQANLLDLLDE